MAQSLTKWQTDFYGACHTLASVLKMWFRIISKKKLLSCEGEKLFLNELHRLHFLFASLVWHTWKLSYVSWFLQRYTWMCVYTSCFLFFLYSFIIINIISTSFMIRRNVRQKKWKTGPLKTPKNLKMEKFQLQLHAYYLSSLRSLVSTTKKKWETKKYMTHKMCCCKRE